MAMNSITFWSGKKEFKSLSNFWVGEVAIRDNGIEYKYESGEHCFHGEKYRRLAMLCDKNNKFYKDREEELLNYSMLFQTKSCYETPLDAKQAGGKKGLQLTIEELEQWSKICMDVQYEICMYKLDHYDEVREDLIRSIGSILLHTAMRCSEKQYEKKFWEGKLVERDGNHIIIGGNKLGEIWMDLREQLIKIVDI